jgi:hypothetical protein
MVWFQAKLDNEAKIVLEVVPWVDKKLEVGQLKTEKSLSINAKHRR